MEANNVAAIFTQHFVRNCSQFVILWQLRRSDWFVNKLFGTWYALILYPFISESDSSVVESSLRNPFIGGSNTGGNYTSFSVSRRMNPFSSENCSFCTLKESTVLSAEVFCYTQKPVCVIWLINTNVGHHTVKLTHYWLISESMCPCGDSRLC